MTITAKFSSTCPACSVRIKKGEPVEWSRGNPARHVTCPSNRPAAREFPLKPFEQTILSTVQAERPRGTRCPTCKGPMSAAYARKGYQCDNCADREEGVSFGMEY